MGTWASDTFGNDYAMDWVQDLAESGNLDVIEGTLDQALDGGAELAAPFAAEALAAIEVVVRLQGKPGAQDDDDGAPDDLLLWVAQCKRNINPLIADKARRAIVRILSEQSELRQLWQDSPDYDAWRGAVLALQARLGQSAAT